MANADHDGKVKVLVQQLLTGDVVTREEIDRALNQVLAMMQARHPDVEFDNERLLRELEAALNVFQAGSVSLNDTAGHEDWLPGKRNEIGWQFWERYLRFLLEHERLPPMVIDRLDTTSFRVLSKLEDPQRHGPWDRRGMVVGQVQSGKTGHYTGLICRAADSGYRLIVVLAGIHNSLRSQTQLRVDAGFLGFDTQHRQHADDDAAFIAAALGVGRLIGAPRLDVASLTTSHNNGDFGKAKATGSGILIGNYPVLLVVKKHTRILDNLREWVVSLHGRGTPKLVRDFAMLVIDDEADNASINTIDPRNSTGEYSDDIDPTKVNRAIRNLLNVFERKGYVGYTATPYANIYIPEMEHGKYGKDLFPASFIDYLRPPSNYFGPSRLFGIDEFETQSPLFRRIDDHQSWVADKHKVDHRVGPLSLSVKTAIRTFVLAAAARLARGQECRHNSMLVHVSRFTAVQAQVRDQIEDELNLLRARIRYRDAGSDRVVDELRSLWETDFLPTTDTFDELAAPRLTWSDVASRLGEAVEPILVKTINGTARDALEYFDHSDEGLNVIAIGGDKLSRGLTLEGLTVSYYLRASRTYDTLLQMGRWFGYRDGYQDLCRLWTTSGLWEAYRGVNLANEELIREFEEMAALGRKPSDYGLRVRDTVAGMLVTSPNKMRGGTRLRIGFSGAISETVVLPCDSSTADGNRELTDRFVSSLDTAGFPVREDRTGNLVWSTVPGALVADEFFEGFQTDETAWRVHAPTIARYIRDRVAHDELTDWTVVLVSQSVTDKRWTIGEREIGLTKRSVLDGLDDRIAGEGKYSIRRVLNPPDEWIDLDPESLDEALEETRRAWKENPGTRKSEPQAPVGWVVRGMRPPARALLLIYPLVFPPDDLAVPAGLVTDGPLMAFAASFPRSPSAPTVEYRVNERFLREFFGEDEE